MQGVFWSGWGRQRNIFCIGNTANIFFIQKCIKFFQKHVKEVVELGEDTAKAPHVDGHGVLQAEDHLRRPVEARLDVRVHCRK